MTVAPHGPDFETPAPDEEIDADVDQDGRHRLILAYLRALSPILAAMVAAIATVVGVLVR